MLARFTADGLEIGLPEDTISIFDLQYITPLQTERVFQNLKAIPG